MTTNAPPSSGTTVIEGTIARLNDGGLKLEGQDAFLDFSRFGTPPPPGLAVGDAVRLVVKPGRDGLPKWIQQVTLAGEAPVGGGAAGAAPRQVASRPGGATAWPIEDDSAGAEDAFAGFEAEGGIAKVAISPSEDGITNLAPVRTAAPAGDLVAAVRALGPLLSADQAQAREDRERTQELLAQLVEAVQQLTVQTAEVAGAIRAAGADAVAVLDQTSESVLAVDGDGADDLEDVDAEPDGAGR
jgi:hypothetical protein